MTWYMTNDIWHSVHTWLIQIHNDMNSWLHAILPCDEFQRCHHWQKFIAPWHCRVPVPVGLSSTNANVQHHLGSLASSWDPVPPTQAASASSSTWPAGRWPQTHNMSPRTTVWTLLDCWTQTLCMSCLCKLKYKYDYLHITVTLSTFNDISFSTHV